MCVKKPTNSLVCVLILIRSFTVWGRALIMSWVPGSSVYGLHRLSCFHWRTPSLREPYSLRSSPKCWAWVPHGHLGQPLKDSAGTGTTGLLWEWGGGSVHRGEGTEAERTITVWKSADDTLNHTNQGSVLLSFVLHLLGQISPWRYTWEASRGVQRGRDDRKDDAAKPIRFSLLPGMWAHEPPVGRNTEVP